MVGGGQLDQGLADVDADHVGGAANQQSEARDPDDLRQAERQGAEAEHGHGREHPQSAVFGDRIAAQIDGHAQGADAERGAQQAEALRPDVQDVAGEDRRQQGDAGQQHHDQIQRDGAEHDLGLPDVAQAFLDRLDRRQLVRVGRGLAAGADQQEGGDAEEEQAQRHGIGQRHVDADDDPSQRRAGDGSGLERHRLGGDGGRQGLATDHHWQKGLAGGGEEGARGSEHGGDRQKPPQRRGAVQRHHQEGEGAQTLYHDRDGHGDLAVAHVGHGPCGQGERQQRQKLAQADEAEIQARLGHWMVAPRDRIDLPQQRRGLDLDRQHRHDTPEPQQLEVPDAPRARRAFWRRRRLDGFGGLDGFCGHGLGGSRAGMSGTIRACGWALLAIA